MSSGEQYHQWINDERILQDLRQYYGLTGELKQLGSCQDINYRLVTPTNEKYVVKYLNSSISWEDINFQHQVLDYLHSFETPFLIPYPMRRIDDKSLTTVSFESPISETHYHLCVLVFIEGNLLEDFKYLHPSTLREIGKDIATFNKLLVTFPLSDDYARQSEWDMRKAYEICDQRKSAVKDASTQQRMMSCAAIAADILDLHENALRHQLIHGDLADYNIIAERGPFNRPKIKGIIDFGDIVESWLIADIAVCIVPLLFRTDHDPIQVTTEIVKGFCSVTPLNESELRSLWHLILLRSVLCSINVVYILDEDPTNQYLLEERDLNFQIFETLSTIPVQFAVNALLEAGGIHFHLNITQQEELISHHGYLLKEAVPLALILPIDLSCENPLFRNANWQERGTINSIIKSTISEQQQIISGLTSSPNSTKSVGTVFEIKYGTPWFTQGNFRSLTPSKTIATFGIFFLTKSTKLYAPWSGVARTTEDYNKISFLFQDLSRGKRSESTSRFGSFSAPKVLEITNEQYTIIIYGLYIASPLVTFESTWNVKPGEKIGEVNSESIEGGLSPIFIQIFVTPNSEVKSYSSVVHYYPPLYATAYEWNTYQLFCIDPIVLFSSQPRSANSTALRKRLDHVSVCQEHYYKSPPQIERGYQQYLYDINGRGYLDLVNNVAVVGHSHRKIADNVYQQLLKLNTNSRFIYSALGDYAEKILEHIPLSLRNEGKLNRVFFVNSGSEATDLALRIARTVVNERRNKLKEITNTSGYEFCRDVICLQGGYHGITTASDEVSTTLNDNPRSLETRASWIHLVPMPNHYRGIFRLSPVECNEENLRGLANKYAALVREKIASLKADGIVPTAFIAEPLEGNAGGVVLPPTYLAQVYEIIHEIGGLCINDEVQVGYGRLGNVFWGFEEHGIVPDIITMAKAAGNGHPLGFVITSEQIAKEFYQSQGSFFSSAGGGPVSCIVGKTVLDIIEEDGLQLNALEVGNYLNGKLLEIQKKFSRLVGCIHGHGLYQGIEIINSDGNLLVDGISAPGTTEASAICERLLELGVITHNTGDFSNVLKVKPPLCITKDDADFFCDALETALNGF